MPDDVIHTVSLFPFLKTAAKIVGLALVGWIATRVIYRCEPRVRSGLVRTMHARCRHSDAELDKRAATLGGVFRKTAVALIWGMIGLMALEETGFNVGPLLAGLGIGGLALGFGAQNLVRDVISGLFLLMENQVRVNDVAIINGTRGLVEEINLRTMVLRSLDGTVHVFPNGTINSLSNMTRQFSYYVFDIGVAYKEDTDRVTAVLKELADEMMQEKAYRSSILAPLEVLGVDQFADSAVIIKARIKTAPVQQWVVGREMNRRIKKRFDRLGIEIPFPHRSLYFGEASRAFLAQVDRPGRPELKAVIREVLEERGVQSMEPASRAGGPEAPGERPSTSLDSHAAVPTESGDSE